MVMSLQGLLFWRRTARFHVQLQLDKTQQEFRIPGTILLRGRVVRVFRTDGQLGLGSDVEFELYICEPGDEPTGPAYIYRREYVGASHMEVYLHGDPPNYELAAHEFIVVDSVSDEPALNEGQLEELIRSYKIPSHE